MAAYRVNLDIFAGPLDLLLYLVRREEVDIYDIPISRITDQYIRYIEMLKSLDIDVAGDFLVMAATLMEIKSAMLLPKVGPDQLQAEDLIDPRAELIRQLLEYKKFKDAANLLEAAADRQKERFPRPDSVIERLKPEAEPEIDIEQVSVWDLLEAFDAIMKATNIVGDMTHIKDDTPIDLYQIEILHRLQTEGPMSFERLFESRANRVVMIGLFLALLELIRDGLVWAKQPKPFDSVYLRALTDEPAEQAVQKTILASAGESEPTESKGERQPPVEIGEIAAKSESPASVDAQEKEQPPIPISELPPKPEPAVPADTERQDQAHIPIAELPPENETQDKKVKK
ncbi:MAG: segregation and condensation protein A [Planctomycetota bacterium]